MEFIRRLYNPIMLVASAANAVGTLVIFMLVVIMNIDIFSRGIFHAPFNGVVEVVVFSLILIVYLQLPDVVRNNRLTRSDGFLSVADASFPGLANIISRLINCSGCVFMGLITWTMWPEFVESIETCHFISLPEFGPAKTGNLITDMSVALKRCEYFGTPGIFTVPWWPAKLAIVFSASMCCVIFFFQTVLGSQSHMSADSRESRI
ncbi:MAG: TRAP transporter small permease subunit [Parvularculales bacterium]